MSCATYGGSAGYWKGERRAGEALMPFSLRQTPLLKGGYLAVFTQILGISGTRKNAHVRIITRFIARLSLGTCA